MRPDRKARWLETILIPAATENPRLIGAVGKGCSGHRLGNRRRGVESAQVKRLQRHAQADKVCVGVLEPWQYRGLSSARNDAGMGSNQSAEPGIIADVDDPVIAYGDSGGLWPGRVHRQHMGVLNDQLCRLGASGQREQQQ